MIVITDDSYLKLDDSSNPSQLSLIKYVNQPLNVSVKIDLIDI
jgi:hypothetical protein